MTTPARMRDLSAGPRLSPPVDLAFFLDCYHYRVKEDVCNTQAQKKMSLAKIDSGSV